MVRCLVYVTIYCFEQLETVPPFRISYLSLKECLAPQAKGTSSSTIQTATKEQECEIWR